MNLSSVSINRPVLATVISILILLFGIIGYSFLGVREYPSVDPPIITVTTNYIGANADVVESQITEVLEENINGIAGIRSLSSTSADGRSTITVEFELDVDLEAATNDVRDRVSQAVRNLPPDCDPPVVAKTSADSNPIVSMTIQSDQRTLLELSEIANNVFKERLQTIPGVSEIRIWGEKKYSMKLLLDPVKLAGYNLTPLDVRDALNKENVELPTGRIEGYNTELSIRTFGRLTTQEDFNELIIKETDGAVIKLKDIGEAKLLPENERSILRGNGGIPQVAVAITPQPGSNYIDIADEFYNRVDKIKDELPPDLKYEIALDSTLSIRKAIDEVKETLIIAFLLVVLIIFAFLRDWRTTLIPVIAIPISLIGAFFIMYIAGFSINILTLLGIVLATGIVVDDAIVVLENIYAKVEKGTPPLQAAHEGSKEIIFAIISTTVTLAAVFLPIIFLQGLTGRLFREFGITVAGAVIISAIVSLTLTPMMSSRILKNRERHNWLYRATEPFFEALNRLYNRSLKTIMGIKSVAFLIIGLAAFIIIYFGGKLPEELAPMEDKGRFVINATAPEGTSFEKMDAFNQDLIAFIDTLPEKRNIIAVTAPSFGSSSAANSSFIRVNLVEAELRDKSQQELADEMAALAKKYNFARTFVSQEQTIGGDRRAGLPVQYVIQAPDFEQLRAAIPVFMEKAAQEPAFLVVDINLKFNKPELTVEIDRDRARALGVTVRDIAETLQLYFSGQRFGFFIFNNKQYQVIGQATRDNRDEPLDLSKAYVKNNRGELIQLDNLVTLTDKSSPPQLFRYNRYVSATISANPAPGYTIGDGIEVMDKIAESTLNDDFSTALAGTSKEFEESSNSFLYAFYLALILIYLILSAQFESFRDPFIMMFTILLALSGAVLSLFIFKQTLNVFSYVGIIVLVGIVTKNGILIVEFANQKKETGLNKFDAVLEAATQRFRPILMTSFATILGALPIALALGASSKSRVSMGIVIVGGLLFSLILTLYLIPLLYLMWSSNHKKIAHTNED
ncbi:MAG: efflux RND transporter permease subunit [Chitinophagales bacterium]|nr:efflux RND transporter permease subunit [Bacteroidota bacterium]MBL0279406.1 efflux RND transporter permease subunit [Bacteroidota bacterium]